MENNSLFQYIHLHLSEDVGPKGRSYRVTEKVIEFQGTKVLVLETESTDMSFCDSSYACQLRSFIVKGYIKEWKYQTSPEGIEISLIEAIPENDEKRELHEHLRKTYNIENISM